MELRPFEVAILKEKYEILCAAHNALMGNFYERVGGICPDCGRYYIVDGECAGCGYKKRETI